VLFHVLQVPEVAHQDLVIFGPTEQANRTGPAPHGNSVSWKARGC